MEREDKLSKSVSDLFPHMLPVFASTPSCSLKL